MSAGREYEMQLYNSIGPNPRAVRIFMTEKGIDLPKVEVDILGGDNRKGPTGEEPERPVPGARTR
jgi:glutathione S-transferase